jgi:hypothetical protein
VLGAERALWQLEAGRTCIAVGLRVVP